MYKHTALLFFSISLFFLYGVNTTEKSFQTHSAILNPTQSSTPEIVIDVESVIFDKDKLWGSCPLPPFPVSEDFASIIKGDQTVKVTTVVKNAEKSDLNYFYTVSGGRVFGTGESVIWDLSSLRDGKYSITVGASASSIVRGKTVTKIIELAERPSCPHFSLPCECPALSITSSAQSVKAGNSIVFEVKAEPTSENPFTYNWTISNGTIIQGQGTSIIKVKTTPKVAGSKLTATIDIGGTDPNCACQIRASETILITNKSK